MVKQTCIRDIHGNGLNQKMCVSHGKALDKTNIWMSIKHQHSLEEMRLKVQAMSFKQMKLRSSHTHGSHQYTTKIYARKHIP